MLNSPASFTLDENEANFDLLCHATDIKKWVNLALSRPQPHSVPPTSSSSPENSTSNSKSISNLSLLESEQKVTALLNAVSLHSQQMSSALETHISQCVTRLPRMTLELNKMISDSVKLQEEMKRIQAFASGSSTKGSMAECIQRVKELQTTEQKLNNCVHVMKRTREVESRIKRLEGLRGTLHQDSRGSSSEAQHPQDDIPQLAEILYDVKIGLEEIRKIESGFASHYNHLLEDCEQWIQDQLEERCLSALVARDVGRASPLFTILHRVGRSSAVLKRSHVQVSHNIVKQCCDTSPLMISVVPAAAPSFSERKEFSDRFMKSFKEILQQELVFWIHLSNAVEKEENTFSRGIDKEYTKKKRSSTPSLRNHVTRSAEHALLGVSSEQHDADENEMYLFLIPIISDLLNAVQVELCPKLVSAAEACQNASDIGYFLSLVKHMRNWVYEGEEFSGLTAAANGDQSSDGLYFFGPLGDGYKKVVYEVNRAARQMLISCLESESIAEVFCQRLSAFVDGEVEQRQLLQREQDSNKTLHNPNRNPSMGLCDDSEAGRIVARFALIESALVQACDIFLSFFPRKLLNKNVTLWMGSIKRFIKSLEVADTTCQSRVLDSLTLFVKLVRPSLLQCKVQLSKHLNASPSRAYGGIEKEDKGVDIREKQDEVALEKEREEEDKEENSIRQLFHEALDALLWEPIEKIVSEYIEKCQSTVKSWILEPLIQKTADYHSYFSWNSSAENLIFADNGGPVPFFSPNSTSASKPVRDLGEAIIEIPVTLDSIRALGVASASNKIWMEEMIEEFFETWLDEIVCMAVVDFVENKILTLQLDFSPAATAGSNGFPSAVYHQSSSQYAVMVWERLRQDLKYLKDVVAAVRNDHHDGIEILDQVNDALQRTTLSSLTMEGKYTVKSILSLSTIVKVEE